MGISVDDVKSGLKDLIKRGRKLEIALFYESQMGEAKAVAEKGFIEQGIDITKLPQFKRDYEVWYSEALRFVNQFIPDRLTDFKSLYKNEKRKEIDFLTYTISDAIIDLIVTRAGTTIVSANAAVPKMQQQTAILKSILKLVDSKIYSINFSIRSDLFDSELVAANELLKAGFLRAAGAMCGVLLEKHLAQVCLQHDITLKKKSPTINDFNEELKNATVIDLPTWRHIQLLGDLRNLCCHDKSSEPTKDQANDLLTGTTKIIKTVF